MTSPFGELLLTLFTDQFYNMWALVDCNSFFCSVEKVFHPGLKNKPVVVLSNNDGCIVALTTEAKKLGLHRGDPIFKVKSIVDANHVAVFSTNMQLYAAMSKRIVNIMRQNILHVENYSIDESFCDLAGYSSYFDLQNLMHDVADKIQLWTDIPVSVGIAPSKTIAKMGSKLAKKYKVYQGVCMIDTEEKRRKALDMFPLDGVWGIGRHTLEKLNYYGVHTPLEFADKSESWVRQRFTKPDVQTWMELNGVPCIDTSEVTRNQTICTSRSFGDMTSDLKQLKAAVAHFAASCANKLRGQGSACKTVSVFIYSNRFREDLQQYGNCQCVTLLTPTSDTIEITNAALAVLESIFVLGIMYKKAGVIVSEICDANHIQGNLFDPIQNRKERADLMKKIDSLNQRYGTKTVLLAVEGTEKQPWHVKCEHRSGNYLTDIKEILTVSV